MKPIEASFYDGQTSHRYRVNLQADVDGALHIQGEGVQVLYHPQQIRNAYRIGKQVRRIELDDGASLEVAYSPEFDAWLDLHARRHRQGLVHGLESKWKTITAALLLTIAIAWGVIEWGIPVAAKAIAFSLPAKTQAYLGKGSLAAMDRFLTSPSKLSQTRQGELRKEFAYLTQGLANGRHYQLVFRHSEKIGANAFALPSGTIVMTDELVKLAHNDGEIEAVLAHEIGHEVYRHSLRQVIQSSSVAVVIALMVGDVSSISSFATTLPTVLVNMSYSRQFETEADHYARQLMLEKHIPLKHFADILTRLSKLAKQRGSTPALLSSHPATAERIKAFQ